MASALTEQAGGVLARLPALLGGWLSEDAVAAEGSRGGSKANGSRAGAGSAARRMDAHSVAEAPGGWLCHRRAGGCSSSGGGRYPCENAGASGYGEAARFLQCGCALYSQCAQ